MKKDTIINIISYAFVLLFVYTALSKWLTYKIYLYDLIRSPELGNVAVPISIIIPGAELLAALLLLIPERKHIGFWLSFILMTLFTLYVSYVLLFAVDLPCTCGGIIRNLSWPQHLVFNIIFTALAATGIILNKKERIQSTRDPTSLLKSR